jgi:hypothetical protein
MSKRISKKNRSKSRKIVIKNSGIIKEIVVKKSGISREIVLVSATRMQFERNHIKLFEQS